MPKFICKNAQIEKLRENQNFLNLTGKKKKISDNKKVTNYIM